MWPYWLILLVPAIAAINDDRVVADHISERRIVDPNHVWFVIAVALTMLIGYRYKVGGDWSTYLQMFESSRFQTLWQFLAAGDPGYQLIQWISMQCNWGIYGVNLISGALFSFGLVIFCRNLPRPWLALAVAVPYLAIVVAMGYTRQACAIGLAMLGLVALGRESVRMFIFWVVLGATFHKSAVLLLPIAALAVTKRRAWTAFWVGIVSVGAYLSMLEGSVDALQHNYVDAQMQSSGAMIRLLMNAVPATILLIFRQRFEMTFAQFRLWLWFSIISLGLLVVLFVSPSSTAVDRVALLFLPLQPAVFSYAPEVFGGRSGRNIFFTVAILLYYAAIQFVWLNFAATAFAWVPYHFYPLLGMF